ncbi:MAG TPA: alanine racemase [Actinomycetota bacterium]|nr:alanine racemase [Actinomycetota bacterium]
MTGSGSRRAVKTRPTVAVIALDAIRHNIRLLKPKGSELMAVVKANAYGHGDAPVARAALEAGATWLGVAAIEEGSGLREAGIDARILMLSEFPRGAEREGLAADLTPTLYTEDGLKALAAASREPVPVHIKVDTGMHRVGLPSDRVPEFARAVMDAGLFPEGLWTHFAKAELLGDPLSAQQLQALRQAMRELEGMGIRPRYVHAANSAATMALQDSHFDLVRTGIAMYGILPGPDLPDPGLRPAMSWRSAVTLVKRVAPGEGISYGHQYRVKNDSTIATVPVGYADGYSRLLSNRGEVVIRGRRHPVAGAVTMDHIMVDCGDRPVEAGDTVTLLGIEGDARVTAEDMAGWMGTIPYEVVCGVSERVPREYVG